MKDADAAKDANADVGDKEAANAANAANADVGDTRDWIDCRWTYLVL